MTRDTAEVTFQKDEIGQLLSLASFCLQTELQKEQPPSEEKHKKRVIVISGPTGCGKSAAGMMLSQAMGGEIISADSMQVYTGMDIGTAKASPADRLLVPHHLLDICHVSHPFNVVDFFYHARHACQVVHNRDNLPIVVGGAGFYLHTLLYGPPSGPPSVPELRKSLEDEWNALGADALYNRLKTMDPEYAATITIHDRQKIIRALEIMSLMDKKVSKLSWKTRKQPQNYDFRCWFLYRPKETLYQMIEERCDQMLERGLLDEVRALEKEGILQNNSAAQAIGYRQCLEYLRSPQTESDYKRMVQLFKQASRQYAKRQYTWFRKEPLFRWLDLDLHDQETAVDIIMRDYERWIWET